MVKENHAGEYIMKKLMKRSLAFTVALVMCLSMFFVFVINADASGSSNTVDYKYSGSYLYNWGEREEVATFLSPKAISFYSKYSITYAEMSSYVGGTSKNDVPSSEMYRELASIMTTAHKKITSYNDTRELYRYTDCENNGSVISSFYSGVSIGPSWDGGATWNREHTWPNSKGEGSSENDIMMLRPTSMRENSSRGNKAYGKSSGYYNPNSESNGEHDLRGDVARIFLYVYVRWGNSTNLSNAWGSGGVMESPEVLIEWMEADPVDTWELGRNDSVEAITGTRNVFVDYPELAFILFGEEIPSDMTTPSGNAKNSTPSNPGTPSNPDTPVPPTEESCKHVYDDCEDVACNLCGCEREAEKHTYSNYCDNTCNKCEKERTVNHYFKDCDDIDCGLCGYVREAINHIYSNYCDSTCNQCGKERTVTHTYGAWCIIVEATKETVGIEKATCLRCNEETEREIPRIEPSDEPIEPPCDMPNDDNPDDVLPDDPNSPSDSDTSNNEKPDDNSGEKDASSSEEPVGFFGKIARFFKNLFKKIGSIFK